MQCAAQRILDWQRQGRKWTCLRTRRAGTERGQRTITGTGQPPRLRRPGRECPRSACSTRAVTAVRSTIESRDFLKIKIERIFLLCTVALPCVCGGGDRLDWAIKPSNSLYNHRSHTRIRRREDSAVRPRSLENRTPRFSATVRPRDSPDVYGCRRRPRADSPRSRPSRQPRRQTPRARPWGAPARCVHRRTRTRAGPKFP